MKKIPLTQGQSAIVCDCHYHLVKDYKWYLARATKSRAYAKRGATKEERISGMPDTVNMHAVINGTPNGMDTDHINHNTLDNRCDNLRTATTAENLRNRGKNANNTSGYKGVSWDKQHKKWVAQIGMEGKIKRIGFFTTAEQAATAYDDAAQKLHREFASSN